MTLIGVESFWFFANYNRKSMCREELKNLTASDSFYHSVG